MMKPKNWLIPFKNTYRPVVRVLAVVITLTIGVFFIFTPATSMNTTMTESKSPLLGNWEKVTRSTCSGLYPDKIQFKENGIYLGQKNTLSEFTLWDAGSYEIKSDEQINISTANDAIITYTFSLSGKVLKFKDDDECKFKYHKIE